MRLTSDETLVRDYVFSHKEKSGCLWKLILEFSCKWGLQFLLLHLWKRKTFNPAKRGINDIGVGKKMLNVIFYNIHYRFHYLHQYTSNSSSHWSMCHFYLPSLFMPKSASNLHPVSALFIVNGACAFPINPSAQPILPSYKCNLQMQQRSSLTRLEAVKRH